MRQRYDEIAGRGAEVLVVGPEGRETFRRTWAAEGFPFVGLADPEHEVADLYGQQVQWLKLGRLPALTVIDREGRVRHRHYGESMRDLVAVDRLVEILDDLNDETMAHGLPPRSRRLAGSSSSKS